MSFHEVVRPFPGPDGRMVAGEVVDTSAWRNADLLVLQRYLRPWTPPAEAAGTESPVETVPGAELSAPGKRTKKET